MNKRVKELWTTALRSGEYAQGTGALASVDYSGIVTYCCLGVLCELAIKDGVEVKVADTGDKVGVYDYDDNTAVLPRPVVEWAEMGSDNGNLVDPVEMGDEWAYSLIDLNDGVGGDGYSFRVIANIIDEQF